ncbi:MAG: hypothetical protein EOO61_13665 [Hymenobacter sp.]|nr:MAG: hypothetical protein EOO61_13665 [Hymenobacter sp.]
MFKHILFKIDSIEETNFSIENTVSSQPEEIEFDIEGGVTAKEVNRIIDVSFKVTLLLIQTRKPILHYAATIKFYIENFDDFVTSVDGQLLIDDFLREKLIDISLNTIRGMLFTKTVNTGLATCYLPLVD